MPLEHQKIIEVYTDGSCHTQLKIGAWAAILFIPNDKIILKGTASNTSHQRMELMAVIEAINYLNKAHLLDDAVYVISDSQYVIGLRDRMRKFIETNYTTNAGKPIQNADLVSVLVGQMQSRPIHFKKIKAHQVNSGSANYNIEADKLCRKMVRELVAQTT